MIRAARFLACAALAALAAIPAAAQDAPPSPHGAAPAPAAANPLPEGALRFRAIDLSAMFEASHGGQHDPVEVPLANRTVRMLGPGGRTAEARTDADGRMTFPSEGVNAGDLVEFVVPDETGADRWPLFAAPPVRAGTGQPGELAFVKVHDGPSPLEIGTFMQTVTVPDREEGTPSVRVNLIAGVRNTSDAIWIGRRGALDQGTFRLRIPQGFTLVGVQVSGNDAAATETDRPDGGRDVVVRERFYPTSFTGKDQMVRLVLSGPYDADAVYDFSFTAEMPIENYRLNLEKNVLHYQPSGDVELEDGGPNPAMSGRETHGWTASRVPAGRTVGVRFSAGKRVDLRVWITLGAIALAVVGGGFLAKFIASRAAASQPKAPEPPAVSGDDRAARIAELDRRLRRGEISSFEHAARKKAVEEGLRAAPKARDDGPARPAPDDLRRVLDEIEARADVADAQTLRRDVRRLTGIVRGFLR